MEHQQLDIIMIMDAARRLLNATSSNSSASNKTVIISTDAEALRETLRSYGSIFLIMLLVFCILQKTFPRIFAIRSWSESNRCELAQIEYGMFNWIWRVFWVEDDDVQDQCGMDTLCFFRMLRFGRMLALMGCFNAIWLLPLYRIAEHAPPVAKTFSSKPLASISIIHVPPGSKRLVGTVVAAYIMFLYAMWLVLKDFDWYTKYRHRFLEKRMARNYAVYVSGIPEEFRSSLKLASYFRRCCTREVDVLEAYCTLNIPNLESKVAKRKALRQKLEHVQALDELRSSNATTTCNLRRNSLNVIQSLKEELDALEIDIRMASISLQRESSRGGLLNGLSAEDESGGFVTAGSFEPPQRLTYGSFGDQVVDVVTVESNVDELNVSNHRNDDLEQPSVAKIDEPDQFNDTKSSSYLEEDIKEPYQSQEELSRPILKAFESVLNEVKPEKLKQRIQQAGEYGMDNVKKAGMQGVKRVKRAGEIGMENVLIMAEFGTAVVENAVGTAVTIVVGHEEGTPREAGFVIFTKLYAVHSALQMIHHPKPHVMDVSEAPEPKEIFWRNVGLPVRARRLGGYLSLVASALLCFFWSIPVAFISSLTQVSSLEHLIPFLKRWLENWPGLAQVLGQLAPLLLYILNNLLLPNLLKEFSKWEGHIGSASLQASVFVKMSAFMIIQTFFVSAISGSIAAELSSIIDNPKSIVDLLANSLPGQSSYFLQIVLVGTLTSVTFTALRVSPLFQAWSRTIIGPRLTKDERNRTWMWLHPLADPPEFFHGQYTAPFITAYMVIFVYSTITPITPWFLLACFLLIESIYRLEFFRNFSVKSDSGGKLWKGFINIILVCMVFAQITLLGFLALKKAVAAFPLMVPLIVITILFSNFINDKHFKVASTLPTSACLDLDRMNEERRLTDFSFVQGKFIQPALQHDNTNDTRANSSGSLVPTATPTD